MEDTRLDANDLLTFIGRLHVENAVLRARLEAALAQLAATRVQAADVAEATEPITASVEALAATNGRAAGG